MLSRVAGNNPCSEFSPGERTREIGLLHSGAEQIKVEIQSTTDDRMTQNSAEKFQNSQSTTSATTHSHQPNDADDEFFDAPDEAEREYEDDLWSSDAKLLAQEQLHPKLSPATPLINIIHDRSVRNKVHADLQKPSAGDGFVCGYGTTLLKDLTCTLECSWSNSDPSAYLVRGETYLRDRKKNKANGTLMQFVGADWLKSDKREDDLGGRRGSIIQKSAAIGGREFFFVVNFQVPGRTRYNIAYYYMMETPLESVPVLSNFIRGDNAYRNSRFKIIPCISEGPWIVKQSVVKKPSLLAHYLEINYFEGSNYFEVDVNVGSSKFATGVASLVLSYFNNLVIEVAFLIQGNTEEELPECLLGTSRVNYLDVSKAVSVSPSL